MISLVQFCVFDVTWCKYVTWKVCLSCCAVVADAKLPVDAYPTELKPNSFALEIATPAGLSLNGNVGLIESFFIIKY